MNDFHLSILRKSVNDWNQWRAEHWNIKPDVSGADLRNINLFKANLEDVNLSGCDLRGAKLVKANARNANFEGAKLDSAFLQGADCSLANFKEVSLKKANLMGAIFSRAYMVEANFTRCDCTGARFMEANLGDAIFYNAKVKGANFEGSNIQDAELYSDQFKEANVPLEQVGIIESKKKTGIQYVKAVISVLVVVGFVFGLFYWIFTSEVPGALSTNIRASLYLQAGTFYETVGSYNYALAYYEKSQRYNSKDSRIYYLKGGIFRRKKEYKKAVDNYIKYLKMKHSLSQSERDSLTEYIYRHGGTIKY